MKENSAYDLSQFAPEREPRAPRVRVVKSDSTRKYQKKLNRLRLRCVLLVVLVAFLAIVTVHSRTKLDETTTAIETETEHLTSLQSEYAYLNYQLESLVSLKNAEDYAKNELGLIKITGSQIEYINLQHENVIEANENSSGFFPFMKYLFSSIAEMFD